MIFSVLPKFEYFSGMDTSVVRCLRCFIYGCSRFNSPCRQMLSFCQPKMTVIKQCNHLHCHQGDFHPGDWWPLWQAKSVAVMSGDAICSNWSNVPQDNSPPFKSPPDKLVPKPRDGMSWHDDFIQNYIFPNPKYLLNIFAKYWAFHLNLNLVRPFLLKSH